MTNGMSKNFPGDEFVPLANSHDPHVDPNDPKFLIPPRFSADGTNPPLESGGLPIAGITHPQAVVVPPHVHASSASAAPETQPSSTQPQAQPSAEGLSQVSVTQSRGRPSFEGLNQLAKDNSRNSLDVGQGSRRSMQGLRGGTGSKKKLGTGMSLSQMRSQKQLQTGQAAGAEGKGMVLPFDPLHLTFHDRNNYVDLPKV